MRKLGLVGGLGPGATVHYYRELSRLDAGEFLDICGASIEELEDLAHRGELTDAKTLIGLLWLQNWRAGRWAIEWRPSP